VGVSAWSSISSTTIDDHSRYAVGSHVACGETSDAAFVVFDKAVAAPGVPQRLLSDNGAALTPHAAGCWASSWSM